ncbi:MAG: hypothetical protein CSA35_01780 [Dethiosulfovibrio peptidovorans]|nr:MAG: hypothetical protein CSA35_01780 [Dethiosulfovibrio peptidovorans]
MGAPLVAQTNKELIYSALKNKILNGQLQGGQQIRVAEIAKAYHVSGTPVREALIQLDGEGYISYAPYRGAVVRNLSKQDVKEIFLIRSVLECLALDMALRRMTKEKYEIALGLAEQGIHEEDPTKLSAINWDFHSYMYQQAELPKLYQIIDSLRAPIVRYVRIYHQMVDREHHHSTHKEIVLAGMAGDRDRAVSLLRESLANACDRISYFIADE